MSAIAEMRIDFVMTRVDCVTWRRALKDWSAIRRFIIPFKIIRLSVVGRGFYEVIWTESANN